MNRLLKLLALLTVLAAVFASVAWLPATTQAQEEIVCESDVVIEAGQYLSEVAAEAYGDPNLYPAIVEATNRKAETDPSYNVIDNADNIRVGWKVCVPSQTQAEELSGLVSAEAPQGLTVDELANATYTGIYTEPVTLTDGRYEGEPFVEGGAARPTVTFADEIIAYGDLNGDGADDAAVILSESSGGSGTFTYVGAVLDQNGEPAPAGTVLIGDRTQIKSMTIENGQIVMEIVTQGPEDPLCCPTLQVRKSYALQDGQLAEVGSEELGPVSYEDLVGTQWMLRELNIDEPLPEGVEITAEFSAEGVSGNGGCNSYSGPVASDGPQALTIGPLTFTEIACPALETETTYFNRLQGVNQWSYINGDLGMFYQTENGNTGFLTFEPMASAEEETEAMDVAQVAATEVITFSPTTIPTETQSGSCFANAIGLGRADAWRCTVGNQIYDPCFAVDDAPTVVCNANPAAGEAGFVLELTEPLPEPDPGNLSQAWLVELADGQVCGLMTGTVVGVGDRIAPYGCPDGSYLFEDFQQGEVWMAEKAVIGLNDDGFFIEQSEMAPISRIWQ